MVIITPGGDNITWCINSGDYHHGEDGHDGDDEEDDYRGDDEEED